MLPEEFILSEIRLEMICMKASEFSDRLQNVHSYIAAVVGYTLVVRDQVIENEAVLISAFLPAYPFDMVGFYRIAKIVDDLFKRIHKQRLFVIVIRKGNHCKLCNIQYRVFQNLKFSARFVREFDFFLVYLFDGLPDIPRMVRDPLEV